MTDQEKARWERILEMCDKASVVDFSVTSLDVQSPLNFSSSELSALVKAVFDLNHNKLNQSITALIRETASDEAAKIRAFLKDQSE